LLSSLVVIVSPFHWSSTWEADTVPKSKPSLKRTPIPFALV